MIRSKEVLVAIFSMVFLTASLDRVYADDYGSIAARLDMLEREVEALNKVIPDGAVLAFNLENCPAGWTPFAEAKGRSLIGAGKGSGLTERSLGSQGGAEKHRLLPDEMPTHSHMQRVGQYAVGKDKIRAWNLVSPPKGGAVNLHHTGVAGSGKKHNNMQPFVVVTYCERRK